MAAASSGGSPGPGSGRVKGQEDHGACTLCTNLACTLGTASPQRQEGWKDSRGEWASSCLCQDPLPSPLSPPEGHSMHSLEVPAAKEVES